MFFHTFNNHPLDFFGLRAMLVWTSVLFLKISGIISRQRRCYKVLKQFFLCGSDCSAAHALLIYCIFTFFIWLYF